MKMPSIYTHNIFANNVYAKLDEKIIKTFENQKDIYDIFSQSFDFLFYYNFLSLFPGKKIRNFGRQCHRNNSKSYLLNIIDYIKKNELFKNEELLAYLYGSINHYTSDTTLHPYINYLSSLPDNKKGMHNKIEFNIDAYYYEKINNKPFYKYNISKNLIKKTKFSKPLRKCLNIVFYNTYKVNNMGHIYEKSYNQSHLIFRLFMMDKYGLKKKIYNVLDLIPINIDFKFSYCSFHISTIDHTFLNKEKKTWYNIKDKTKSSNESWDELFIKAENKSINLITLCHEYFNNKISRKRITQEIENLSYANGLLITTKDKHFKIN